MKMKRTTIAALLVVLALCLTGCNSSAATSDSASAVDSAAITASAAAGQTAEPATETPAPATQTAAPAAQTALPNEQDAGAEATATPVAENTAAPAETPVEAPTEAPAEAPAEEPVTVPVYEEPSGIEAICGEYFEVIAGRGTLVVTVIDDETVAISVDWASSAAEVSSWQMTGTYDAETNSVFYSDCVHTVLIYTEDGACTEELVYENGTGHFDFATGTAGWTDDQSENPDSPSSFAKEGYMP